MKTIELCKDLPKANGMPFNQSVIKATCKQEPACAHGLEGYSITGEYLAIKMPDNKTLISNMPWDDVLTSFPTKALRELAVLTYWDIDILPTSTVKKYFNLKGK